jgi:dTMP kinase
MKLWRTIFHKMPIIAALEGIDGAGKTTQARNLVDRLRKNGHNTVYYHYTGKDNYWGRIINQVYANNTTHRGNSVDFVRKIPIFQELLYGMSARSNLETISHEVSRADLVISDRSIISAYATHLDHVPLWFMNLVEPRFIPNVAFYLDIPVEIASQRIKKRSVQYTDETGEALQNFQLCYDRIINNDRPHLLRDTRFYTVDSTLAEEVITDRIYEIIKSEVMHRG